MRTVEDFPFEIREIEHVWIPMPDRTRLAARVWLPVSDAQVPAIVEYIPYGKRWGTRVRDEPMHRWFAGHGYAAIRIDVRGSGESEGLLEDEYTTAEQQDGADAIAWLAGQEWCDGNVGLIGKSWGGFAALQIAAKQPPALKAVIAVCASDDRYTDDAHYMGGCLLPENVIWGAVLFNLAAMPPDPELVGPGWRKQWRDRLDRLPLYAERWMKHPNRDDYWKQGSVAQDYARIQCPVFAISGWADGYTNAVPRMLAGLTCQRRGLIGPWAHLYPHEGKPGPAIGFLQEAKAWFDHWLRGGESPPAPMLRAWVQEFAPVSADSAGRWVGEEHWPSPRIKTRRIALSARSGSDGVVRISTPLSIGQAGGPWCAFGAGDQPGDQREEDKLCVCFDTPITERTEILGAPLLRLRLSCDKPFGQVVARLCDVAPGGSQRVSYGVLNLRHHSGDDQAVQLIPGREYDVTVRLNDCGHAFAAGHTLRVALSTSYWPVVWPEREPFTLTVHKAEIELPVRPPTTEVLPEFAAPEQAAGVQYLDLETPVFRRESTHEDGTLIQRFVIDAREDGGPAMSRLEPIDLELGHSISGELRITESDPASAAFEITNESVLRRKGWDCRIRTEHRMTTENGAFVLKASVETWEHDIAVFSRLWEVRIPR